MDRYLLLAMLLLLMPSFAAEVEELSLPGTKNVYRVTDELYRGGQPDKEGFDAMEKMGVRSVLNLREYHRDNKPAHHTQLRLIHYPLAAGKVQLLQLLACVRAIEAAPKPVYVHCWHGSDRTGIVVAAYRILVLGWTPERAEAELRDERFGFHKKWYPNLLHLLRSTDWQKARGEWQAIPAG